MTSKKWIAKNWLSLVSSVALGMMLSGCTLLFGPDLGPLRPIQVENTPAQIERGKYIATRVSVCLDCHSKRDWSRFSGPIVPGTEGQGGELFGEVIGLPGNIYAKNITPAGIGEMSDAQVLRAFTEGVRKDGTALFPIMPYHNFSQMTEDDAKSVIAYLRTLKPITNTVPKRELNFPVNFIVNTMPASAQFPQAVDKTNSVNYGKYLFTLASCAECHTPMTKRGKRIEELALAGGMEFPLETGIVRSSNITPHPGNGIGAWSKETFIARFKSLSDPAAATVVGAKQFNTIMPWTLYGNMDEADLAAIYDYMRTLAPIDNPVEKFTPAH